MNLSSSIKILSLNVHKGFAHFNFRYTLPELRDAIRSIEPDLVFLQEVLGENHLKTAHHANASQQSQYEYLADSIWSDYAYGKNAVYAEGHHGNAILSKFPIQSFETHDISIYALEQRGLLHCQIQIPDWKTRLHCLCVHTGLFSIHRRLQFGQIVNYVEREVPPSSPLIIAGDLNDWTHRARADLEQPLGLREAHFEIHGKLARTFPGFFPLLRLDRIYLRQLKPVAAAVLSSKPWSRLSDHAGLLAEAHLL